MSALLLNVDLLDRTGARFTAKPNARIHGWRSATEALEKLRLEMETQLGEKVFLIADERDRASEFAFYFRDKRAEGPAHPPVYIPETQDLRNQFSLWPRYDEFVDAPAAPAVPSDDDPYTEQDGVNRFIGRSALFIRDGRKDQVPRGIRSAFASAERVATIEVRRHDRVVRELQVFLCRNYQTLAL